MIGTPSPWGVADQMHAHRILRCIFFFTGDNYTRNKDSYYDKSIKAVVFHYVKILNLFVFASNRLSYWVKQTTRKLTYYMLYFDSKPKPIPMYKPSGKEIPPRNMKIRFLVYSLNPRLNAKDIPSSSDTSNTR